MAWSKTVSDATTSVYTTNSFIPASGTAARSVCFAFKTSATYPGNRYMGGWGENTAGQAYRWRLDHSSSYRFRLEVTSGNIVFSTTGLNDGNWHYVAFGNGASANVTDTVCYIDGTLQTTFSSTAQAINTATTYPLYIGVDYGQVVDNSTPGPVCEYAEVAVYDRELSAGEMIALSKGVSPGLIKNGRVVYWPLIRQYVDYDGSTAPSVVGSNYTISTHPRIIYPSAQIAVATASPAITRVYTDSATQYAASATSVTITIDNSVQAGDLISIYWMCRSAFTVPSGWTSYHEVQRTGFNQRSGILLKTSDGTEGGTTVTLTQASAGRIEGMHAIHRSSTGALAYSQGQALDAGTLQSYTCPPLTESDEFLVLANANNVYSNANELAMYLNASADAEYERLNTTAQPNTDSNRLCCFDAIYKAADTSVLATSVTTTSKDAQISMLTIVPVSDSELIFNWNGVSSYSWNGVTSIKWNGVSSTAPIPYSLRATFSGDDTSLSDGDSVNIVSPGSVEEGSLTIRLTSGTADVIGGKLRFAGGTGGIQVHNAIASWFTPTIGQLFKTSVECNTNSGVNSATFGCCNSSSLRAAWQSDFSYSFSTDGFLKFGNTAAGASISIFSYTANTPYELCYLIGGYNLSGVPYKNGDTKSEFSSGQVALRKDGSNWKLIYKFTNSNPSVLYPYVAVNSLNSWNNATYDNVTFPDADLSALLQPLVLDTFTDTNGTALTAHTPDVDSVGNGWSTDTEGSDIHEIQSGLARANGSTDRVFSVIDTGKSDVFVEQNADVDDSITINCIVRYQDINNHWSIVTRNVGGTESQVTDRVAGTYTTRATGTVGAVVDLQRVVVTCDDEEIACFIGNVAGAVYSSATNFKTETKHGFRSQSQGDIDNFAVYPIGNGGEYNTLDNY